MRTPGNQAVRQEPRRHEHHRRIRHAELYDTIEEKQENELRPLYDKLLPIIMMSTFGAVPDDFDFEFKPVRRAPEDEMVDLASKNTGSVAKVFQAGLISQ